MARLTTDARIARFRAGMDITCDYTYLNHASTGPLHRSVRRAVNRFLREQTHAASLGDPTWQEFMVQARASAGKLIGAPVRNVCLMHNCAVGLVRALSSIALKDGDEVVYLHDEFATLYFALLGVQKRGAKLREVKAELDDDLTEAVARALTPRTRIVAVSWVGFLTGRRLDLARLSEEKRRRGFYFIVDGYQGIGPVPLNVAELSLDFLVCGGAKWLMSPLGSGFMYASDEMVDSHEPDWPGWYGVAYDPLCYTRRDVPLKDTAVRFETGTNPLPGMYGMKRSIDQFNAVGEDARWRRVQKLTAQLLAGLKELPVQVLTPEPPELRAGIVTFRVKRPETVMARLERERIVVSLRDGLVRVSPHFWNTDSEIDHLLSALKNA